MVLTSIFYTILFTPDKKNKHIVLKYNKNDKKNQDNMLDDLVIFGSYKKFLIVKFLSILL